MPSWRGLHSSRRCCITWTVCAERPPPRLPPLNLHGDSPRTCCMKRGAECAQGSRRRSRVSSRRGRRWGRLVRGLDPPAAATLLPILRQRGPAALRSQRGPAALRLSLPPTSLPTELLARVRAGLLRCYQLSGHFWENLRFHKLTRTRAHTSASKTRTCASACASLCSRRAVERRVRCPIQGAQSGVASMPRILVYLDLS